MQTTSENYAVILADPLHVKQVKVTVGGTEYGEDQILSLRTFDALYAGDIPAVGGCVARGIELSFTPLGDIPRMAEICVFVRLAILDPLTNLELRVSEWLPKGVFYIDTRSSDSTEILSLSGYDAMLKAEQVFLSEADDGDWPQSAATVVDEIAERMGVSVDPRTVINQDFLVSYPLDYTCRELLSQIAVAHAGNWVVTDVGQLRLVGLAEIPAETNLLVDHRGRVIQLGGVAVIVG